MSEPNADGSTAPSAAVYSRLVLSVYDLYVVRFSNTFVWKCPSRSILDFYNQQVSSRHLDVGVGTGYFLDKCRFPTDAPTVALLDLNPNSLQVTARRLRRYNPTTHVGNVMEPVEMETARFASIGLNYLLHCLPGDMASKSAVFDHLKPLLADGGRIFGTTILGQGVQHNFLARRLMRTYNDRGIFGNLSDNAIDLAEALRQRFRSSSVRVVGCVAFFTGQL